MFRKTWVCLLILIVTSLTFADQDLARYTPTWIKDGFADAGTTHEPWIFQVRRNRQSFNQWQRQAYDYRLSDEYIKTLADAGITVYHIFCYKGFGFEAEKAHMQQAAKAAAIAHKYGMKVDTYVQWNTLCYETFFAEVPEAKEQIWYQIDVNGKPIMLPYGYQQSFRFRPCFNHNGYMNYYKQKILRYVVEEVKTDFIHFDNFGLGPPGDVDHNPATIAAFRKYLKQKYTPDKRLERFGFTNLSHILPPMWNDSNPAEGILTINDPAMQEWVDFRCWTLNTRLAECARFVRRLNKEIVIETNPHGLTGNNRAWEAGIDHPSLMQYTNVIWTEDDNYPRWSDGVAVGKFRHYKLGRITNNFIMTYNRRPQDYAENLALNRTIGSLGIGAPEGIAKKYLDFWHANKNLYNNTTGAEKVAVLRSYPSMAYNNRDTHIAINMAEQALQQMHIPFAIIFDRQLDKLENYDVLVLANQESLTNEVLNKIKQFVHNGGGLVATGDTGRFDGWRRLRKEPALEDIFQNLTVDLPESLSGTRAGQYGKGRAIYISRLLRPDTDISLGYRTKWVMPTNADQLKDAVLWTAGKTLPLIIKAPQWVGVSHDTQQQRDIIHLFNYHPDRPATDITLAYQGTIKKAWAVSPDRNRQLQIPVDLRDNVSIIRVPGLNVYEVIVLEK